MILAVKGVSKRLGKFHLEDISCELPEGYIMGLIGPNGAGKTSLIHLILGLYRPDCGEVLLDGKSYSEEECEIRELTGSVLLEDLFDGGLTLLQNGKEYGQYYKNYSTAVLENYIHRFGLHAESRFKELSRGEKLKFQFAFAMAHDARLLVLDEPTGNFDPTFREEFFTILKEFIADGRRSVVLSTHLTEDLDRLADYILYLEKGKVLFSGDIETLHDTYRLVYGEKYKIKLLPQDDVICMEEGEYGTKALLRHRRRNIYDSALTVTIPTIEELMYFMTKRGKRR